MRKPPKKFAWNPKSKLLYKLMASPPGVVIINWVFQGMLGMDRSELIFHVGFDFIFIGVFFLILINLFGFWLALVLSVLLAHTANWLINSHFWVMGRYIGISRTSVEEVNNYISSIKQQLSSRKSLKGVVVIGNLTRSGSVRETSDLDVRLIRQRGFLNAVFSNLILIREKAIAFFNKFPLDIYLCDHAFKLSQLRNDEIPILLKDKDDEIAKWYKSHGRETEIWRENLVSLGKSKHIKICIVCSGGGHLTEAKLATSTMSYPRYYVTFYSPHHKYEKDKYYHVINPYRNISKFFINFCQSYKIFKKEKPDIIITTGASVAISTCLIAKIFRKKVIFVESSGNPLTASVTGRFLYKIVDLFYVQWSEQLKFFSKARCIGSLI